MIALHTIENFYDHTERVYHQFVQRDRQALLDSTALGRPGTLRDFLKVEIIGGPSAITARQARRLEATLESGDIAALLVKAMDIELSDYNHTVAARGTRFGYWTYDSVVIVEPALRERVTDPWSSDLDFPREAWKHEVSADNTTLGYWEWVEEEREHAKSSNENPPSQ